MFWHRENSGLCLSPPPSPHPVKFSLAEILVSGVRCTISRHGRHVLTAPHAALRVHLYLSVVPPNRRSGMTLSSIEHKRYERGLISWKEITPRAFASGTRTAKWMRYCTITVIPIVSCSSKSIDRFFLLMCMYIL